jgi:hypothetical protein
MLKRWRQELTLNQLGVINVDSHSREMIKVKQFCLQWLNFSFSFS